MSFVDIQLHPPQLRVGGRRIHHAWIGVAILLSDYKDWRVWVSDLKRKP
jgi:hypothetical protein